VSHTHRHGSFLGELNLFNNRKSRVGTQAASPSRLFLVGLLDCRRMLSAEPEIAKTILKSALHRRTSFIRKNASDGRVWVNSIRTVFVMIGAIPNTEWLQGCVELDDKGFVVTQSTAKAGGELSYQTSVPGIFAIGDVWSGSIKRVASAVGEGSVVVTSVHQHLNQKANIQNQRRSA
jgi:pyruvate/2-oxoglutarate dehydrogenase complex dihydrolipoamide dehydrogenase (E3) component